MRKAASIPESYLRFVSKDEPRFGKFYNSGCGAFIDHYADKRAAAAWRGPRRTKQIRPILFPGAQHPVANPISNPFGSPISFLANT
jgi:hypothetical protein